MTVNWNENICLRIEVYFQFRWQFSENKSAKVFWLLQSVSLDIDFIFSECFLFCFCYLLFIHNYICKIYVSQFKHNNI